MKRILITGASGFLGSHLSLYLNKFKSDYKIITTDKTGAVDLLGNLSDFNFVKKLGSYDIVIHCAGVQYVTKYKPLFFRKKWFYLNNVKTAENLKSHFLGTGTFFILIGTSMQYFQDGSYSYSPLSQMKSQGSYSWSKLKAFNLLSSSDLPLATVIPCVIGGNGRGGLFTNFIKTIFFWKIAIIPGKGANNISIVHVSDLVRLIEIIARKKVQGVFNAAADDALKIIDWVKIIESYLKIKKTRIIKLPLLPVIFLSKILFYRFLAQEQLLMLSIPHVLNIQSSKKIGWKPKYKSGLVIKDIVNYTVRKFSES
jgi:nucleoside-diphosphate-sugar epimerase